MPGDNIDQLKKKIIALSRYFYEKGWASATSGNYSARTRSNRIIVTASGKDKAILGKRDLVIVDLNGNRVHSRDAVPSAEAPLHCELYRWNAEIRAVAHVHSIYSTVLSLLYADRKQILISGYEMLKALQHVATHDHTETVPVVSNSQNIGALCKSVRHVLEENRAAHAFLIAGHGLYTWGREIKDLRRHVEALEFLLECEYHRHLIRSFEHAGIHP